MNDWQLQLIAQYPEIENQLDQKKREGRRLVRVYCDSDLQHQHETLVLILQKGYLFYQLRQSKGIRLRTGFF